MSVRSVVSLFSRKESITTDSQQSLRQRIINLFWTEKLILIFDNVQVFGLLWICANPWPWPYLWLSWMRWTVFFNVDIFSLTPNGALAGQTSNLNISPWGDMSGYLYYALGFALVQIIPLIYGVILYKRLDAYGTRWHKWKSTVKAVMLILGQFFYAPVTLAIFRLYYCEASGVLSADRSVICASPLHTGLTILCSLLIAPLCFGLPYLTYKISRDLAIYNLDTDHEKRIQAWELFYILNLDDEWLEGQVWVVSSFNRTGAFFRFHTLLYKLYLIIVFIGVRQNLVIQAFFFWFGTVAMFIYYGVYNRPYRCHSTNAIAFVILAVIMINATFGMMNAFGAQNAVMVASAESAWLLSFTVLGLGVIATVMVLAFLNPLTDWPSVRTMHRIENSPKLFQHVQKWVACVKEANAVKFDYITAPDEIADIGSLEESIRTMRHCWVAAKSRGSIFTLPLGEILEELTLIHSNRSGLALRSRPHWDQAYLQSTGAQVFPKRELQYVLMAPRKRRLLNKLLAMRAFLDGANVNTSKVCEVDEGAPQHGGPWDNCNKSDGVDENRDEPVLDLENGTITIDDQNIEGTIAIIRDLEMKSDTVINDRFQQHKQEQKRKQSKGPVQPLGGNGHQLSEDDCDSLKEQQQGLLRDIHRFEEMFTLWDQIIVAYENDQLPGQGRDLYSSQQVENWYTYRASLSQALSQLGALEAEGFDELSMHEQATGASMN